MRVISGIAKGRRLFTPKGRDIRPTSDRVKEAIFNIIGPQINSLNIIDVFAGTGSLGIEALSRGAGHAFFIDSKREAIGLIQKNLELTGFKDNATVINTDADKAIRFLIRDEVKADLIFLDPPYRISVSFLSAIISNLVSNVLQNDGLIIVEHTAKSDPLTFDNLKIASTRTYGDTAVTIYERKGLE